MADLQQLGDDSVHHDSGYEQEKSVQRKLSEIFGENTPRSRPPQTKSSTTAGPPATISL